MMLGVGVAVLAFIILVVIAVIVLMVLLKRSKKKEDTAQPEEEDPNARWRPKQQEGASPEEDKGEIIMPGEETTATETDEEPSLTPDAHDEEGPATWTPPAEETTEDVSDDISRHLNDTIVEAPELDTDPVYREVVEEVPVQEPIMDEMVSEEVIDDTKFDR